MERTLSASVDNQGQGFSRDAALIALAQLAIRSEFSTIDYGPGGLLGRLDNGRGLKIGQLRRGVTIGLGDRPDEIFSRGATSLPFEGFSIEGEF